MNSKFYFLFFIFSSIILFSIFYFLNSNIVFASTTDGTIDSAYKYAWSENTGWINFGCSNCNIHITDSALTGYAWSENYGWINLNPATSGVTNNNEGALSGYGWGENTGWINFSGVLINSSGIFSGTASSAISGQISFNCDQCQIKTDWRPRSARPACNNSSDDDGDGKTDYPADPGCSSLEDTDETDTATGGGGSLSSISSNRPALPLGIVINNGEQYTTSYFVALDLQAGFDVGTMAISNYPDFSGVSQENYVPNKSWDICSQRPASVNCPVENTSYTVYVRYFTKQGGQSSESFSNSIIYVKELPKKSFIERLPEFIQPFIPEFLKPKPPEIKPPEIPLEQLLSKEAPSAMRRRWILLDPEAVGRLVFAPLPNDIKMLAQKLPELGKTFSEVGVNRMTELEKIQNIKFTLPGLTAALGLPTTEIEPGKFALPKSIALNEISPDVKKNFPTEIIFAKTGGELIDFNISLSLTEKGESRQKITTIVGKPLKLVIKPDKPIKAIKGYVVFRSQKSQLGSSFQIFFDSLLGSLFFAQPRLAQVQTQPAKNGEVKLVLQKFEYTDPDGDGIYTAEIMAPLTDGEYEIITVIDYLDPALGRKDIVLVMVIDPEGYVYEKQGDRETRVPGAIVSLYWLNQEIKQYELWPAKQYQQENPQMTDITGKYAFIVPEGFYYLKVDAPSFLSYDGKPFEVREGSGVHINIKLKTKYWWLKIIDWKTVAIIFVIILLCYNFYRDRLERKKFFRKFSQ